MMNPSTFYSPLHSMWAAGAGTFASAPAITPTSSTSAPSPPTSRDYETGNASPDNYGYPPTPPKEVKVEESYPNSSAISGGEMYKSRPEGSQSYTSSTSPTFQSSSDLSSPFYGSYSTTGISSFEKSSLKSSSKSKNNQSGKILIDYLMW